MKDIFTLAFFLLINIGYAQNFNTYNYNTQNSDVLWDIIEYDSGYLLTGYSQDSGLSATHNIYAEPVIIKLSKSGYPIDTLVTAGFGYTEINLLSIYNKGYFYVFGVTNSPNDSFRLFVTKYDTLFNQIQRKEYPQLQGKYFRQLHKTKETTDSSQYLIGYYLSYNPTFHDASFIMNYSFDSMEIFNYGELPVSGVITDVLVDDTSYFCTVAWYNVYPWAPMIMRYDKAFNVLSKDTLFAVGLMQNNVLAAYHTLKRYRDSLYLCSGFADIVDSNYNFYASIVVQTYSPDFEVISQKHWYYDDTVNIEPSYNNSFVENSDNEYFVGATLNLNIYYPDQGMLIAKVDSSLNTIWQKHIPCTTATMRIMNLLPVDDGGVLVLFWEQTSKTGKELYNSKLMKIGSNGEVTSIIDLGSVAKLLQLSIFPNPTHIQLNLSLNSQWQAMEYIRIYDIQGKLVLERNIGAYRASIDVSGLAKGMYFVQGQTIQGERFSGNFLKE